MTIMSEKQAKLPRDIKLTSGETVTIVAMVGRESAGLSAASGHYKLVRARDENGNIYETNRNGRWRKQTERRKAIRGVRS